VPKNQSLIYKKQFITKMSKTIEIKISSILEDLKNGYTRLKTDKNYDSEIGSIQEKYGLNGIQVFELFKHEKLKGKKTIVKKEPAFTIIDDTNGEVVSEVEEVEVEVGEEEVVETEEVPTPGTETSTDIDEHAVEETEDKTEVEEAEPAAEGNPW